MSTNALLTALDAAGLTVADDAPPALDLPHRAWTAITDVCLIRFSGPDTRRFLQGQVTCQLDDLSETHALLGAACTPKGRAYASFRLLQAGDTVLMGVHCSLAEATLAHLKRFAAFFKVNLSLAEDWGALGMLGASLDIPPGIPGTVHTLGDTYAIDLSPTVEGLSRREVWGPVHTLTRLAVAQGGAAQPAGLWPLARLRAGEAWITEASREQHVPQHFNWQHLDGIHFRKGCYTGQEIIARMRYLGQLKKSLYRVQGEADIPPAVGTGLADTPDAESATVGDVVNSIPLDAGRFEALVILPHARATAPLYYQGRPVSLCTLPYAVPEQSAPDAAAME